MGKSAVERLVFAQLLAIMERQLFVRLLVLSRPDGENWVVRGRVQSIFPKKLVHVGVHFYLNANPNDPFIPQAITRVLDLEKVEWELKGFLGDELYDFDRKPWILSHWLVNLPSVALEGIVPGSGLLIGNEPVDSVHRIPMTDYRILQAWAAVKQSVLMAACSDDENRPILRRFFRRVEAYARDLNRSYKRALDVFMRADCSNEG